MLRNDEVNIKRMLLMTIGFIADWDPVKFSSK